MEIFYFGLKCVKPRCHLTISVISIYGTHLTICNGFAKHDYIEHLTANVEVV